MKKYRRNLGGKHIPLDTPQIRAAINLVNAVRSGHDLNQESLEILASSFEQLFAGKDPKEIFQEVPIGFALPSGRPNDSGFKSCDIVTGVFELAKRRFQKQYSESDSIAQAKKYTIAAFEMDSGVNSTRKLNRDLADSDLMGRKLSNATLESIIKPYEKNLGQK